MVVLKFLFVVLLCFPIAVIGFYSIRDAAKTKNNFKIRDKKELFSSSDFEDEILMKF